MKAFLFILLLLYNLIPFAQDKQEKETRIKETALPESIRETLSPFLSKAKNIRYYQETDGDHQSFEIKFTLKREQYSVEFDNHSKLEDIEVTIDFKSIPPTAKQQIASYLKGFEKYKLRRVQKQYSSDIENAATTIQQAIDHSENLTIQYEIVADLKEDNHWQIMELLFDQEGQLLSSRRVLKRAESFIIY